MAKKPIGSENFGNEEELLHELELANEAYDMINDRLKDGNEYNKQIRDELEMSNEAFERFEDVFQSIHNSLTVYTTLLKEMAVVNRESLETEQRKERLASVEQDTVARETRGREYGGFNIGEASKKAGGLATEFFGNLFANIFSAGGIFGLGASIAAGAAGLLKTAGLVTIVAPWVSDFITEVTKQMIDATGFDLDPEAKKSITDFAGDTAMGAVIGRALFGKKGMVIGALTPLISKGISSITDALGVEVEKFKIAGFEFDQNDLDTAASVAVAAGAATLGPALLGKTGGVIGSLARSGLMAAGAAISSPALLAAGGAAAVAVAGHYAITKIKEKVAADFDTFKANVEKDTEKLKNLKPDETIGFLEWMKNRIGLGTDSFSGAGDAFDTLSRMTQSLVDTSGAISEEQKKEKFAMLEMLASKTGIDLNNPFGTEIKASIANDIAETLGLLGDARAKTWKDAVSSTRKAGHASNVEHQKQLLKNLETAQLSLKLAQEGGSSQAVLDILKTDVDVAMRALAEAGVDPNATLRSIDAQRDQILGNQKTDPSYIAPGSEKQSSIYTKKRPARGRSRNLEIIEDAAASNTNNVVIVNDNKKIDASTTVVKGGPTSINNDNRTLFGSTVDLEPGFGQ